MTRNTRRGTPGEIEGMWPRDERVHLWDGVGLHT